MAKVTFQVVEGVERGEVFRDLETPISIGREDENAIRLNDERVSRFHAKVQEDAGRIILTDLESTNGTRVNGHPIQMRVLRPGDHVLIGRSILLYGTPEELAALAPSLPAATLGEIDSFVPQDEPRHEASPPLEATSPTFEGPPGLPRDLSPGQRAELSDLLAHLHRDLTYILLSAQEEPGDAEADRLVVPGLAWRALAATNGQLAGYIRRIAEPEA